MDNDSRYAEVNDGTVFPAVTREEAAKAFAKLTREFGKPKDAAPRPGYSDGGFVGLEPNLPPPLWKTGKPRFWTDGKGYRRVWVSPKPTIGHSKGWGRLVHDTSHMVHSYRNPKARPHEGDHHRLEAAIMNYVKASGWLTGTLRPVKKPKPTLDDKKTALEVRLARWESKARRADRAIRKLKKKIRHLSLKETAAA